MWIHSELMRTQIWGLSTSDYHVEITDHAGSKTHREKQRVFLEGTSSFLPNGSKRRKTNSGNRGAGTYPAATYDEWGEFLAALFELDPTAKTDGAGYNGRDDFHVKTKGHYLPGEGVVVHYSGTGGGGYEHYVRVPAPTNEDRTAPVTDFTGPLSEWWEETVFPHTGSGKGGYSVDTATITDAPGNPADLVGLSNEWEG